MALFQQAAEGGRPLLVDVAIDLQTGLQVEDACWRATAFSADRAEGVAAFAEKRAPNWPGEDGVQRNPSGTT